MTVVTTNVDLTNAQRTRLRLIFGCADEAALDAKLGEVARAALQEHLDMFLGDGAFTRGSDFREHRLAMLVLHAFGGTIPSEAVVSRMFQSTRTGSRALLRAMISKYQIRLEEPVRATLLALLEAARPHGNVNHRFTSDSPVLIDQLNQILGELPDPHIPIASISDQAGRYAIDNAAMEALKQWLEG